MIKESPSKQSQQQQWALQKNSFSNALDSPQFTYGIYPQKMSKTSQNHDPFNILQEFSIKQIQQLSHALSMISTNQNVGNKNVYANTTCLSPFLDGSINSVFTKPWILGSRATDHMTSDSALFTKTQSSSIPTVNLPIGSTAPITSIGNVSFNSDVTLDDVLCVPSFT